MLINELANLKHALKALDVDKAPLVLTTNLFSSALLFTNLIFKLTQLEPLLSDLFI